MEDTTRDDFMTFILIYAAHVDLEFKAVEKEFIIKRFGKDCFARMNELFDQGTDYDNIQWIKEHKDRFIQSEDDKKALVASMVRLFSADGEFDLLERNMAAMINRLLA